MFSPITKLESIPTRLRRLCAPTETARTCVDPHNPLLVALFLNGKIIYALGNCGNIPRTSKRNVDTQHTRLGCGRIAAADRNVRSRVAKVVVTRRVAYRVDNVRRHTQTNIVTYSARAQTCHGLSATIVGLGEHVERRSKRFLQLNMTGTKSRPKQFSQPHGLRTKKRSSRKMSVSITVEK